MKKFALFYIAPAAFLMLVSGCDKYLNEAPLGLVNENVITEKPTINTITSLVDASYIPLSSTLNLFGNWDWSNGLVIRNDFIIEDIASGDMLKKWNPDGDQAWMDQLGDWTFTASNGAFNGIWSYDYEGVSRTNRAIAQLMNKDLMTQIGMDETSRERLLGEVYFLRAFYYFDLVTNFGDVPLLLKPLAKFDEAYEVAKRVSKNEVWNQISEDLNQAYTLLPQGRFSSTAEKWRASKGAAIALQAKTALYNQKWQDVVAKVNELQTLNYYHLNANYFDNFDATKEFADEEVIFAYDHQQGKTPVRGNGLTALIGWGFIAPSQNFLNEFEANDPRLAYTVNTGDKNVYKLLGAKTSTYKGSDDSPVNRIYIRWADVLLWKAEASNELGNYSDAISLINTVRQRARITPTFSGSNAPQGTLPDRNPASTDKAQIRNWLIHERRVELGFEAHRMNDLRRWGIAKEVLSGMGVNFQDNNYLYPIPQGEIDKSGGLITQNPGY